MKILVACEFSGAVRNAFARKGHTVMSCDLLPGEGLSDSPGRVPLLDFTAWPDFANLPPYSHYRGDVRDILDEGWDMMLAFPPCTYLAVSGARWWKGREKEQADALEFVRTLMDAPIPRIALENPVGKISTAIRKPDQYIQPWQFGHGETKKTGLWLKNLPKLTPTRVVEGRHPRVHLTPPGIDRWKERSKLLPGIAEAMAEQWG